MRFLLKEGSSIGEGKWGYLIPYSSWCPLLDPNSNGYLGFLGPVGLVVGLGAGKGVALGFYPKPGGIEGFYAGFGWEEKGLGVGVYWTTS